MIHACPRCGASTEGAYSEGGLLWAICSSCMRREQEQQEEARREWQEEERRDYEERRRRERKFTQAQLDAAMLIKLHMPGKEKP